VEDAKCAGTGGGASGAYKCRWYEMDRRAEGIRFRNWTFGADGISAAGEGQSNVDDTTSTRHIPAWVWTDTDSQSWQRLFGAGCDELADASVSGSQGREQPRSSGQRNRPEAHGSATELCGTFLFPPGPSDVDNWLTTLAVAPHVAPATSFGDIASRADQLAQMVAAGQLAEKEAEPELRSMVDGLAARTRALRLLGNGVVPLAAAYAWRTLSAAHGLGCVDLGAANEDRTARAVGV